MRRLFAFLAFFCAFSRPAGAGVFDARTFTLDNGMRVVAIENRRAPVVTHMVWYKTGSTDDPFGKSGVAHVLEHLMFKGTAAVPDGEFSKIVARNGGTENAFTSRDYTAYYQNIARDRLELVMFLESDRMRNLRFSEQSFAPELEVVKEERLMRTENSPAALLAERRDSLLWGEHPYARPVIGWKKELAALTAEDAERFYDAHYSPDNAVLVVAGDIDADELKPLAEKYYGAIPPNRAPVEKKPFPTSYPVTGKIEMRHPQVHLNSVQRVYAVPSYLSKDKRAAFAFTVLEEVLGAYHSGKLHRRFIDGTKTARYAGASYDGFAADRGVFSIALHAADGVSPAVLERELDRFLKTASFADSDVAKAKKRLIAGIEHLNDDPETSANVAGLFYVLGLSIDDLKNRTANIAAVSPDDVRRAFNELKTSASVTTALMPQDSP